MINQYLLDSVLEFSASGNTNAVNIGTNAGYLVDQSRDIVAIGNQAAYKAEDSRSSVNIGNQAGQGGYNNQLATFIGPVPVTRFASGGASIYIGHTAGWATSGTPSQDNIFIGTFAGRGRADSNSIIISSQNSSNVDSHKADHDKDGLLQIGKNILV